jgi:peptidoglycan/LPS O-acetylase OafA/YrhL
MRDKTVNNPTLANDKDRVTLMKGAAIIAVVGLHVLSSLPGKIFREFPMAQWFIALDQLWRFSVPIFIGLSGYALTRKYWKDLPLGEFLRRRFVKLLPLYLLWTIGLRVLFILIPAWYTTETPLPWWQVVLLGSGDYHLYFVPLILQFYFLFPVLFRGIKKFPTFVLLASIGLQLISLYLYRFIPNTPEWFWLYSDQTQYSLFISWIGYFVTGMWLAGNRAKDHFPLEKWLLSGLWVFGWLAMSVNAARAIQGGLDPLYALKFTRLLVVPYGLLSIALAVRLPWEKLSIPAGVKKIWLLIGEWSFLIYLCHTLVLRLIFARDIPGIGWEQVALATVWLVAGLILSRWLENPILHPKK